MRSYQVMGGEICHVVTVRDPRAQVPVQDEDWGRACGTQVLVLKSWGADWAMDCVGGVAGGCRWVSGGVEEKTVDGNRR